MTRIEQMKEKWARGGVSIGGGMNGKDNFLIEVMGWAGGFDYLWLDGEHSAIDLETSQLHIMTTQAAGMAAFYRVRWNDRVLVKPILDMGPDAVVFPMIKSADEAKAAVAACLYPPKGVRSYSGGRDDHRGTIPIDEFVAKSEKLFKVMQIEHYEAVKNLKDILKVEGVDSIVIGASDLSASIGKLGHYRDPQVMEMLDTIAKTCVNAGVPFGVSGGFDPVTFGEWLDRGVSWIGIANEYRLVMTGSKSVISAAHEVMRQKNKLLEEEK